MSKRVHEPVDQVRHADLQGAALPRDDGRAVSVRLSGWYLQLWKEICRELPELTPSDIVRRALLVTGATLFKEEDGSSPDVYLLCPESGVEKRLDAYLGLDGQGLISQRTTPVERLGHSDLRGAAKPREESYAISLRVFGFYRQLYDQIVEELGGLSPSDAIRRCLLVLAATVLKNDGRRPEVYVRRPGAEPESLDAFLGLDAP